MATPMPTKHEEMSWVRILRRLILATIAIGAFSAIVALIGAESGPLWKVTGTSFLITGAALVSLPSAAVWERGLLGSLPLVGIGTTVAGFGLAIYAVWAEPGGTFLWKLPVTLIIVGVGIAGVALLEFARLSPGQQWVLAATRVMLAAVGALLILALWAEIEGEAYWRGFGITAVLLTALLASVPILHRSSRANANAEFCPMCGASHSAPIGDQTVCPNCRRSYRVSN